jgi:hypothetical protein
MRLRAAALHAQTAEAARQASLETGKRSAPSLPAPVSGNGSPGGNGSVHSGGGSGSEQRTDSTGLDGIAIWPIRRGGPVKRGRRRARHLAGLGCFCGQIATCVCHMAADKDTTRGRGAIRSARKLHKAGLDLRGEIRKSLEEPAGSGLVKSPRGLGALDVPVGHNPLADFEAEVQGGQREEESERNGDEVEKANGELIDGTASRGGDQVSGPPQDRSPAVSGEKEGSKERNEHVADERNSGVSDERMQPVLDEGVEPSREEVNKPRLLQSIDRDAESGSLDAEGKGDQQILASNAELMPHDEVQGVLIDGRLLGRAPANQLPAAKRENPQPDVEVNGGGGFRSAEKRSPSGMAVLKEKLQAVTDVQGGRVGLENPGGEERKREEAEAGALGDPLGAYGGRSGTNISLTSRGSADTTRGSEPSLSSEVNPGGLQGLPNHAGNPPPEPSTDARSVRLDAGSSSSLLANPDEVVIEVSELERNHRGLEPDHGVSSHRGSETRQQNDKHRGGDSNPPDSEFVGPSEDRRDRTSEQGIGEEVGTNQMDEGAYPRELFVPGTIVHVIRVEDGGFWPTPNFGRWKHKAVLVDRTSLREMPIHSSMFLDHLPWR